MRTVWRGLGRRTLWAIGTLLLVSFAMFVLVQIGGGDVARNIAGEDATEEMVERIREQLGLTEPLLVRYWHWLTDAVRGDLDRSLLTDESVSGILLQTLPITLSLVLVALITSTVAAIPAGLLAARFQRSWLDRGLSLLASAGVAVPSFVLALILVREVAVERALLPAVGYVEFSESPAEWITHLILPALALSGITFGELVRHMRSSAVEVLSKDYIMTARAKGLGGWLILTKHVFRNAALPVVTILGLRIPQLLGSTVIVEYIFVMHGTGHALVEATMTGDINLVLGITMAATVIVVAMNLIVDVAYLALNPKLRVGEVSR